MDIGTGISVSFKGSVIGEIFDVNPPSQETAVIDVTTYSSSGAKQFITGDLYDNGEMTIEMAMVPSTPVLIPDTGEVVFTFPDGAIWTFDAFVSKTSAKTPLEDKMSQSVTFKVSGEIVITAAP